MTSDPSCAGPCGKTVHAACARSETGELVGSGDVMPALVWCDTCVVGPIGRAFAAGLSAPCGVGEVAAGVGGSDRAFSFSFDSSQSLQEAILGGYSPTLSDVLAATVKCLETVTAFKDEQTAKNNDLSRQLEEIRAVNATLESRVDRLHVELEEYTVSGAELVNRYKQLRGENDGLKAALTEMGARVSHLERASCESELIISGVSERSDEDLTSIARAIFSRLRVDLSGEDLRVAHRIGKTLSATGGGSPARPRGILVRLSSVGLRNQFIAGKRRTGDLRVREMLSDLDGPAGDSKIYVNEGLAPSIRRLLAEARRITLQKGWSKCWVKNGFIYIRKEAETCPVRVGSSSELQALS